MINVEISSDERKSRSLHGYCKTAHNHHSLTLKGLLISNNLQFVAMFADPTIFFNFKNRFTNK